MIGKVYGIPPQPPVEENTRRFGAEVDGMATPAAQLDDAPDRAAAAQASTSVST